MHRKFIRSRRGKTTIYFLSLGCPKNRVDTEVMAGIAETRGLVIVADPSDAEIIVVDTCAFIEPAREESVDALLEMARYKTQGRCRVLVAAGCLAQRHGTELAESIPELDHLLGTEHPDWLERVLSGSAEKLALGPPGHFLPGAATPRFLEPGSTSAYVKIGDGCSRRCSFCAIPSIRGKARSRPLKDVVAEVQQLVSRGIREVNLVSQDTSAYGIDLADGTDLVALVRALDALADLRWVRLLYLYPDAVTDELLFAMRDSRTLVPYLDIPIQHASTAMLRRMRRGHGPLRLRRLVTRVRKIVPQTFLRTSVLVGHPGETQADFDELLNFLTFARFDHLGAFRYSSEAGTPSFGTGPAVPRGVSYARWRKVMALGRRLASEQTKALRGQIVEVLVEGTADDDGFVLVGRHAGQAPEVDGITYLVSAAGAKPGEIVSARVIRASEHDLVTEPV